MARDLGVMSTLLFRFNKHTLRPSAVPFVSLLAFSLVFSSTAHAVTVGPAYNPSVEPLPTEKKKLPDPLDLIPITAVVPILDVGFSPSDPKLEQRGIWPELRKTEAIRSAIKLKDALIGINQFESVQVVPDTSASSDFYLVGVIKESTGEILRIQYMFIDATGRTRLNRTDVHRVEPGWHARFAAPGVDPFQPLYDKIAIEVWKDLKKLAEDHKRVSKRKGKSSRLSEVETIGATRELMFAQYFNPGLYKDAISPVRPKSSRDSSYKLNYLPDRSSSEWSSIETIKARDQVFIRQLNQTYGQFMTEVDPKYAEWQNDIFPTARQIRLAKRSETISNVTAGALAVATVAAAVDADSTSGRDTALAVGGVLTSAALIKGAMERQKKNRNLIEFNELSQSYHDSFTPMRVSVGGEVVSLQGTAVNQFNQWRELLRNIAQQEDADIDSIKILD